MHSATETHREGFYRLTSLILRVFGLYIAVTIACVVLVAPFIDYPCNRLDIVSYGVPLFLLSLLVCVLAVVAFSRLRDRANRPNCFLFTVFGMAILLLASQLYIERSAGFIAGWDVNVLTAVGDRMPADTEFITHYFSVYPNQLFLYGLFRKLASLVSVFGLSSYRALVYGGCLCVTTSIVLVTFVCRRLFGEARALFFQFFASLFIGINAWVLVPYSDTYGMLFTCVALWFYVIPRRRPVRLFGVTLASLLGYMVKPTAVFLLFAAVFLGCLPNAIRVLSKGVRSESDSGGLSVRRGPVSGLSRGIPAAVLAFVAPVFIGAVLAMGIGHLVEDHCLSIDESMSRGVTHFLAMGINPEQKGVYSEEENQLSDSIADPDERRAAQLALWVEHLSELGPNGLVKIWFQKNLANYADGTFAWWQEGGFIQEVTGDSPAVTTLFGVTTEYEDGITTAYGWYCQILWLAVLVGCSASVLRRARDLGLNRISNEECSTSRICAVIALALIFLSGFLLIFECRARYLFLYSPYYVLLAIDGLVGEGSIGDFAAQRFSLLRKQLRKG